jgi:hypothetical protein
LALKEIGSIMSIDFLQSNKGLCAGGLREKRTAGMDKSLSLQKKLNLTISEEHVFWFF